MSDPKTCPSCGTALPADATRGVCPACLLEAGFATGEAPAGDDGVPSIGGLKPKFPGLAIEALVGRGGMGVVYRARHKALDREVALKVLSSSVAADPAFADRFQREARALAKLQHPSIVAVHDFGTTDGLYWLVMEYVDGVNVREAMKAGNIGPTQALAIVPQICDALQYAHERGVVHRDIKPENLLLDKAGRVKVADLGLAKLMDRAAADVSLTGAGQVMGTLHYMAPEQWERPKDVDHRADIYSLGVVFYEMLTGELPVGRFAAPSTKSSVDARIDEIVLRTLEREREARYQQVSQVKTDMGVVAECARSAAGAAPASPKGSAASRIRTFQWTVTGAVAFVVICWVSIGVVWMARTYPWSDPDVAKEASVVVPAAAPFAFVVMDSTGDPADLPSAERLRISSLWTSLQTLWPRFDRDVRVQLYSVPERQNLTSVPLGETEARSGKLGLPLLPAEMLSRPLSEFWLTSVRFTAGERVHTDAIVCATDGTIELSFPLVRPIDPRDGAVGEWYFARGDVGIATADPPRPAYAPAASDAALESLSSSSCVTRVDPDARGLMTAWARLAAAVASGADEAVIDIYRGEDREALQSTARSGPGRAAFVDSCKSGLLGMPLWALHSGPGAFSKIRLAQASARTLPTWRGRHQIVTISVTAAAPGEPAAFAFELTGRVHRSTSGTWTEWFFQKDGFVPPKAVSPDEAVAERPKYEPSPSDASFAKGFAFGSVVKGIDPDPRDLKAVWVKLVRAVETSDADAAIALYRPDDRAALREFAHAGNQREAFHSSSLAGMNGLPLWALELGAAAFSNVKVAYGNVMASEGEPGRETTIEATMKAIDTSEGQKRFDFKIAGRVRGTLGDRWIEWQFPKGGFQRP